MTSLAWMTSAACKGTDPDEFFPLGKTITPAAKAACSRCEVRADCLHDALAGRWAGTWGGMGEDERRKLRRRGQAKALEAAKGSGAQ